MPQHSREREAVAEHEGVWVLLTSDHPGAIVVARIYPRKGMQVLVQPDGDRLDLVMVDITHDFPKLPTSFIWEGDHESREPF